MVAGIIVPGMSAKAGDNDIIVLYTNDVHCSIDDYAVLAAYRAQLISEGYEVVTVDAGDAIQGEAIGTLTEGSAIEDLMSTAGYDFAVPGNHEFDYGMDTFLSLAEEADYEYLSCNFVDLRTDATVFQPYQIKELSGEKVAFLGISTPETYTKSTPVYFQDRDGNYIYSFCEDEFYETIQAAVDAAIAEGAERVVAIGHLGIDGTTEGWKSTDVIENTTGIDVFLDGHSHEMIASQNVDNKDGDAVLLTSTQTKFAYFGQLTLKTDGTVETQLINPDDIDVDTLSAAAQAAYNLVNTKAEDYEAELAYLYEVLGTTDTALTINDPVTNKRAVRSAETNMGDFVADAYRSVTGADIAFANGGGVRANIPAGDVTRKMLMDVNPWSNEMCVIRVTGQQILDALEHGARKLPEENGGFLQVSGLTYEVHTWVESPVVVDSRDSFVSVDNTKERRVANVKIGGVAVNPTQTYTLAGSAYMLQNGGDGYTMFADAEVVRSTGLPADAAMLIQYFTDTLHGRISAQQYGNVRGDGRIKIYASASEIPKNIVDDGTGTGGGTVTSPKTGEDVAGLPLIAAFISIMGIAATVAYKKRHL